MHSTRVSVAKLARHCALSRKTKCCETAQRRARASSKGACTCRPWKPCAAVAAVGPPPKSCATGGAWARNGMAACGRPLGDRAFSLATSGYLEQTRSKGGGIQKETRLNQKQPRRRGVLLIVSSVGKREPPTLLPPRTTHTYTYAVRSRSIQCSRVLWCKRPALASRPQGPDQGTECVCATRCMQPPRHLQLHSALALTFKIAATSSWSGGGRQCHA